MSKQWQLYPPASVEFLALCPDLSQVVAQLLYNRGLRTSEAIERFLYPERFADEYDPFLFRDMAAAIALTIEHIKKGSKIAVCGDYDADGVTSSALLEQVLRTLKADAEVWIPSRFGEGYGLNKTIVAELAERGFGLLITVDNGIRAKEEITYARSLGLDVIVTDHHERPPGGTDLSECLIINPILEEETYPYKYLCGAGVAFKFAQALVRRSMLPTETKIRLENSLVDLAAIGTVSDCVSLTGENRWIVRRGLAELNRRPRVGVRELAIATGLEPGSLTEWNIGWQLAPRLNAAGRIDHATTSYRLLATRDVNEARVIAAELNQRNIERQALTEAIVKSAADMIEKSAGEEKLLVVTAPDVLGEGEPWPEGVIGLAAGRLAERFSRPCLVICKSEGKIKASGRSVEPFDVVASLEAGKEYLERYGGHKMACGFTIRDQASVQPFIKAVTDYARSVLEGVDLSPILRIEAEIAPSDLTAEFITALDLFKPYGQNNAEPKFVLRGVSVEDIIVMGKDKTHIKFQVAGCWAIGFNRAIAWQNVKIGDTIDVVGTCEFNNFNGRSTVQLKIVDLKPSV